MFGQTLLLTRKTENQTYVVGLNLSEQRLPPYQPRLMIFHVLDMESYTDAIHPICDFMYVLDKSTTVYAAVD